MITMQVTQEEYDSINKAREERGFYKPVKIGFLKEDMWLFHNEDIEYSMLSRTSLFTDTDKEQILKDFPTRFEFYLKKGTKFLCYLNGKEEIWSGPEDAFEAMTKSWALLHLVDIKPYEQD